MKQDKINGDLEQGTKEFIGYKKIFFFFFENIQEEIFFLREIYKKR